MCSSEISSVIGSTPELNLAGQRSYEGEIIDAGREKIYILVK